MSLDNVWRFGNLSVEEMVWSAENLKKRLELLEAVCVCVCWVGGSRRDEESGKIKKGH